MIKHTPGPWVIHYNPYLHATSIRSGHHICVMRTNNITECNANAHLIAAAPELLEALQELVLWGEKYPASKIYPAHEASKLEAELSSIIEYAKSAISKALNTTP